MFRGIVLLEFDDRGTRDIFECKNSKISRKTLPSSLHRIAKRKLDQLAYATELYDLMWPPGNKLESLKGNLKDYYSIRINDQWRVVFKWVNNTPIRIQIIDYHK